MEATTSQPGLVVGRAGAPREGRRRRRLHRPHLRGARNVADMERLLSVVGGGALTVWGSRRRGAAGTLAAIAGAALVERGLTGHCRVYETMGVDRASVKGGLVQQRGPNAVLDASRAVRVEHTVTIDRPRAELYSYWRQLENLPHIMRHLQKVRVIDDRRSRWTAKAPAGQTVEWEAEIHNEVPDELLAWKSVGDTRVPNAGSVHFTDAPDGRGTVVRVLLEYVPPGGRLGAAVAGLFHEEPGTQVREDLRHFKAEMESQ